MARPRIEIDNDQFKKLCGLQCTLQEISSWFRCSSDTIERWCQREMHMSFADAYKTWSADGRISLRRIQFKMAEKSPAMAIFLGKQYLGQQDRFEYEDTSANEKLENILNELRNTAEREAK